MPCMSLSPFTAFSRSFLTEYLHTSTCKFLDDALSCSSPCPSDVREYLIYTDGSGGSNINKLSGPPSWAFVVVAVCTDGRSHIVGYLASPDPSLTDTSKYKHPSAPAEFSAALWFVCWLLQSPEHVRCKPFTVYTDNVMVVKAANFGSTFPYCGDLPVLLDGLIKLARVTTQVTWKHVHGHSADPLNELADTLATLASQ